jgi:hypothetical protein
LWPVVVMDCVGLAWVAAIWWFKQLSYRARVINFLCVIFMVGVGLMLVVGSVSQIYLVAVPVLAAVLLGMWPALTALGISALTIFLLSAAGLARLHAADTVGWIVAVIITVNYLFVGAIITLSCSILLQRLARSLDDLRVFADSLQQGKNDAVRLNAGCA